MTTASDGADIGHNNPPSDEEAMRLRLEESHAKLLRDASDLELKAGKLPKIVESDEDANAISAWVVAAGAVGRRAEGERKEAKDPYLRAGQAVDAFFGAIGANIKCRITTIDARKAPYLKAKRDAEEAAQRLILEQQRRIQQEAEVRARQERQEQDRIQREADEAAARLRNAATAEETAHLQRQAREANERAVMAGITASEAADDAADAEKQLRFSENIADLGNGAMFGRVQGGGANSMLKTVWTPDVHNRDRLISSLGALGPFFTDKAIEEALARAAKAETRPAVSGVDWVAEDIVKTKGIRS